MKYAKRMVLIPEEFMDMIERKESIHTAPLAKSMIRLDKKMDGILEDTLKATDDKVSQYSQNLQRFLDVQEKKRQFIPTVKIHQESGSSTGTPFSTNTIEQKKEEKQTETVEEEEGKAVEKTSLPEHEILESVPKNSRTLAKSMINRLKANSEEISWNQKGEISINGHPIQGSNIIDLVNDQLRPRKKFNPKGWEQFSESLEKINMPRYLMRNEKRRSHIAQLNKETPSGSTIEGNYTFPPTPPTTPRTTKTPSFRRSKAKRFSDNWILY